MQKVSNLIDIKASCKDVFQTIIDIEKRMQLSPLWGLGKLLEVSSTYPEPGSRYRIRILTDAPFGLSYETLNATQSVSSGLAQMLSLKLAQANRNNLEESAYHVVKKPVEDDAAEVESHIHTDQEYFVSEYQPPYLFSYYLDEDRKTIVTWRFQNIPYGTRINYEEVFFEENIGYENFIPTVRHVIHEWLTNIKRYSELHDGRIRLIVRWFLDKYYLRLRPDQRRVVQMILLLQVIGLVTFAMAVIGWGITSLFF